MTQTRRVKAHGIGTIVQADKNFWGWPLQQDWFGESEGARIIRRCPIRGLSPEEELLAEAATDRAAGEYDVALAKYATIVESYPVSSTAPGALSAYAETYADYISATGDTARVQSKIEYLEEQAESHPNPDVKTVAKLCLAREYEWKGEWEAACTLYTTVLQETQDIELKGVLYRALVNLQARAYADYDAARIIVQQMVTAGVRRDVVELAQLDLALFTGEILPQPPHGAKAFAGGNHSAGSAPTRYSLEQNFPNPFNSVTEIWFKLGADGFITLKLYDVLGSEIKTLAKGNYEAGYYSVTVDASDLSSGVYFYRMTAGNYTAVKKLLVMK